MYQQRVFVMHTRKKLKYFRCGFLFFFNFGDGMSHWCPTSAGVLHGGAGILWLRMTVKTSEDILLSLLPFRWDKDQFRASLGGCCWNWVCEGRRAELSSCSLRYLLFLSPLVCFFDCYCLSMCSHVFLPLALAWISTVCSRFSFPHLHS